LLLAAALCVLIAATLFMVLALGPHFHSFPDRTIGISVLSDVDPHYRTYLFLLLSALAIILFWGLFVMTRWRPGVRWKPGFKPLTGLLAGCVAGNLLLAWLQPHTQLFMSGAALSALLLVLWLLHLRLDSGTSRPGADYLVEIALTWQGLTLLYWVLGIRVDYSFLVAFFLLFPAGRFLRSRSGKLAEALASWILTAPLLMIMGVEVAYFVFREENSQVLTFVLFAIIGIVFLLLWLFALRRKVSLSQLAACSVLVSTAVLNEYSAEIVYRGYDVFHLAERVLPLQQFTSFGLYPVVDFQPAHGLFDVFPHALYQWFSGGDFLESMLWGNGYFHGWLMRAIYIAVFFLCLAALIGGVSAFFLLWLLPHFHLVEPYNTLLLLPVLNLYLLITSQHRVRAWVVQWLLVILLGLWRPDFALVVIAGNLVVATVMAWYERSMRPAVAAAAAMLLVLLVALLLSLAWLGPERLAHVYSLMQPYMGIQIIAASYDHFFRQWDYMATLQYLILPGLGALAGGYSLARVYLREDHRKLALHMVIIFLTAIGFAMAIRMFHRHTIAEGFSKPYFFLFCALLMLSSLRFHPRVTAPLLALAISLSFLAAPKMRSHSDTSLWGPQRTYPLGTRPLALPEMAPGEPRLVDNVKRFNAFEAFMQHYLQDDETLYDFSNAPLVYAMAGVRVPLYINETVYHTSETMQASVLRDLRSLRTQKRLPFVVFRQNNPWDALDGVDNALRSYRVAEFIYDSYKPCIKIGKLELWIDKRKTCQKDIEAKVPESVLLHERISFLDRNYLQQFIAYRHLPFIWANFDRYEETIERKIGLRGDGLPGTVATLRAADLQDCSRAACYLDLQLHSPLQQEVVVRFARQKQLSFVARPGLQSYRVRISALWRWYRGGNFTSLQLSADNTILVEKADLIRVAD